MSLEEFAELVEQARKQLGCKVSVHLKNDGTWHVVKDGPFKEDLYGGALSEAVSLLKKWATPPKPPTITLVVPTEAVEHFASPSQSWTRLGRVMHEACVAAMKPYQPREY